MQVDLIHTGISAAYISLWLVIANVTIGRRRSAAEKDRVV